MTPEEQQRWLDSISKPSVEETNILEFQKSPEFKEQIDGIVDALDGCSRYRAAKMIRQSMLGVG